MSGQFFTKGKKKDSLIYSVFELERWSGLIICTLCCYHIFHGWISLAFRKNFPSLLKPQQLLVNYRSIHVMYFNGALLKLERDTAASTFTQPLQEAHQASLCQGWAVSSPRNVNQEWTITAYNPGPVRQIFNKRNSPLASLFPHTENPRFQLAVSIKGTIRKIINSNASHCMPCSTCLTC